MILGDTCTRSCGYCDVKHGTPQKADVREGERIARAVKELGLHYVVITSVTRDDLRDGGAAMFAKAVYEIRVVDPDCAIEVLVPDFNGNLRALRNVLNAHPTILNHNIETVERLFPAARPQGDYRRSLNLLKEAKKCSVTKSGFMVGLGETREEILKTMRDLCSVTDILTIGQYLQPTKDHMPVVRYYTPEEFKEFKEIGLAMGFKHVESGPLVRSSYHAREYGIQAP
jgi:lipoic acid synthetase